MNLLLGSLKPILTQLVNFQGQELVKVSLGTAAAARFLSEMDKIARGVYFHQFEQKAREKVVIYSRGLEATVGELAPIMDNLAQANETLQLQCILRPKDGANPDVFYYQFDRWTESIQSIRPSGIAVSTLVTSTAMLLVFYGRFEATAIFKEPAQSQSE